MTVVSPFILCGGAGTRLWPLSREAFPKQFHKIGGPETLFQQTCRRLTGDLFESLSVLSNQMHRFLIADQLQDTGLHTANIVLEPVSRNTAPAACVAALMAARSEPGSLVLLAPSDYRALAWPGRLFAAILCHEVSADYEATIGEGDEDAIARDCNEHGDHHRHGYSSARGRVLGKPRPGNKAL